MIEALIIVGMFVCLVVGYNLGLHESDVRKEQSRQDTPKTVYFGGILDNRCTRRRNGHRCTRKVSRLSNNNWCNSCEDARHGY